MICSGSAYNCGLVWSSDKYHPSREITSSEQLYRDSLFYKTDDLVQSFKDVALNAYYNMKAASGEYAVQFNDEYAAFIDEKSSEVIAIVKTRFNNDKN